MKINLWGLNFENQICDLLLNIEFINQCDALLICPINDKTDGGTDRIC